MKKLIGLFFILTVQNLFAQSEISGYVLDSLNGKPLVGASILLDYQGKNTGMKTDEKGYFQLVMPAGKHLINIRYTGYISKWINIENGDKILEAKINLQEVSTQLEQVVVTSKGYDQSVRKPVLGVNQINIKTLQKIPSAFGEIDLFRSLQMLPGVSSVGEASNGVNIRGGTTDQNLILLDDMPIFNPTHMFGLFSVTPPDAVSNLDLYKGNVPARYGGRAASVLEISLKTPNLEKFQLNGGVSLVSNRLMLSTPIVKNKLGIYLAGRGSYNDFILPKISKQLEATKATFGELVGKIFWRVNDKNTFTISAYGSNDFFQTGLLTNLPDVVGTSTFFEHNTANAMARWLTVINSKMDVQTTIMVADYKPTIATIEAESDNEVSLNSSVLQRQAKSNLYYQLAKQKIETGLVFTNYSIKPGSLDPGASESVNALSTPTELANEMSAYIDDEFSFTQNIAFSVGLRYSYFKNIGPAEIRTYLEGQPRDDFSVVDSKLYEKGNVPGQYHGAEPRFGLRIATSERSSVKMGYNLMRQYIQIISNTTTPIPTSRWKTADTHIKPQISHLITAGYYKTFDNDIYEINAEAYFRGTQNIIDYKPGANFLLEPFPETQLVQGQSKAYGLELMVSKKKGIMSGWANYTYARTFNKTDEGLNTLDKINNGEWYRANYDKPHSFNASVDFNVDEHNSFAFNFVYSTGRPFTEPVGFVNYQKKLYPFYDSRNNKRIPDYHRLDFSWNIYNPSMKHRRWQGHWAFSVYNFYGRKNVYSVFLKTQDGLTKAYRLTIFGAPVVSLAYNFKFE